MLDNYLNYHNINEENNEQINYYYSDNNEEGDNCVNNKYMFSLKEEKKQNKK